MTDVQNWHATKEDRLKPMMHRQTMKAALELTRDIPKTAAEESSRRKPIAYLGPNLLVKVPRIRRAKMVPVICSKPFKISKKEHLSKATLQAHHMMLPRAECQN